MKPSAAALLALRSIRSRKLSNSNAQWTISRTFSSGTKQKGTGKAPASGTTSGGAQAGVNIEGKNMDPPSNVFKKVEPSGMPSFASKQGEYKNPEYFSYHNMTYTDMELVMAKMRVPQPSNKK